MDPMRILTDVDRFCLQVDETVRAGRPSATAPPGETPPMRREGLDDEKAPVVAVRVARVRLRWRAAGPCGAHASAGPRA